MELEANNLACLRGERTLFKRLDFSVGRGELLLVQGANGAGKTSLLRMVCGLLAPDAGEIRWRGQPIESIRERYHAQLTWFGHTPAVKDELTAVENLRFACGVAGTSIDSATAVATLAQLGLTHGREHLPAKALSQGQRRRIALARLALGRARLWILDEPLTALDQSASQQVQSLLGAHLRAGGMAVVTTHHPLIVDGIQPKVLQLSA